MVDVTKLTDEQIEKAAQALYESYGGSWATVSERYRESDRKAVRAAAPFLQVPWDDPTTEELALAWNECAYGPNDESWPNLLRTFVLRRNAALQPKPVDPRIEIVVQALQQHNFLNCRYEDIAEAVLAALDGAK